MNPLRAHGSESLAFPAPSLALTVAGRAFEVFPCPCRSKSTRSRRVPPPSLAASTTCPRSPDVAIGRTPEPFASSASPPAREVAVSTSGHADARPSRFDHPSTSPRLLLEVPSVGSPIGPSTPGECRSTLHRPPHAIEGVSFRPRGFSPPRRLPPDLRREHCCSPQPTLGFTVFPATATWLRRSRESSGQHGQPRFPRCTHPAKMLPTSSAFHRSPHPPKLMRSRVVAPSMTLHGRHRCRTLYPEASSFTVASFPLVFDFEVSFRWQVFHCRPPLPVTDSSVLPWASVLPPTTGTPPDADGALQVGCCAKRLAVESLTSKSSTEVPSPR